MRPTADLLDLLRSALASGWLPDSGALAAWGLRPLSGGRNNHIYAWDPGTGDEVCLKIYKPDGRAEDRRRFLRESHALAALAAAGVDDVPRLLWQDPAEPQPVTVMSLLPGTSLPDRSAPPPDALKALCALHTRLHQVALTGPLRELPRVDDVRHYMHRLITLWPAQLAGAQDERLTAEMLTLLRRWAGSSDQQIVLSPTPAVFSHGDANLLNWLWDNEERRIRCVDFEFAGYSTAVFDAADLIEHISARAVPDDTWEDLLPELGIGPADMQFFRAAQRTCALRWLAVLWRQRHTRTEEFESQRERVIRLFDRNE
jgi:thiamine kinase-like enzyme